MKTFVLDPTLLVYWNAYLAMKNSLPTYVQQTYNAGGGNAPAILPLPPPPDQWGQVPTPGPDQVAFYHNVLVPLRAALAAFFADYQVPTTPPAPAAPDVYYSPSAP